MFHAESVSVPVISVGNLTTGGSGKTPCVEYIAAAALNDGHIPGIVSRGYKRRSAGVVVVSEGKGNFSSVERSGDEPIQIAKKFPRAIVVAGERRADAARSAVALGADCIIADDAFQHRSLRREIDVVVCTEELSRGKNVLFPAGNGREPLRSLSRAHAVLFPAAAGNAGEQLRRYSTALAVLFEIVPDSILLPLRETLERPDFLADKRVVALSGIANPHRFVQTLASVGARVMDVRQFPDHHWFSERELRRAAEDAARREAVVVTTEKDWMRIAACPSLSVIYEHVELCVVRVTMNVVQNKDRFIAMIRAALAHNTA